MQFLSESHQDFFFVGIDTIILETQGPKNKIENPEKDPNRYAQLISDKVAKTI